jgi:hypothetical protein
VAQAIAGKALPDGVPIEIWFQDEMRVGQKNGLVYQWAKKGTRPRQPKDQRYANAYLFGAICPARDTGAALVLPYANAEAMQHHLEQISRCVAAGAHAVLTLDKAGWHTTPRLNVPSNISLLPLPPASPELNPSENVWQYLRQTYLSNRLFSDYETVVEASSSAWNKLAAEQGRIASIGSRTWAAISQGP